MRVAPRSFSVGRSSGPSPPTPPFRMCRRSAPHHGPSACQKPRVFNGRIGGMEVTLLRGISSKVLAGRTKSPPVFQRQGILGAYRLVERSGFETALRFHKRRREHPARGSWLREKDCQLSGPLKRPEVAVFLDRPERQPTGTRRPLPFSARCFLRTCGPCINELDLRTSGPLTFSEIVSPWWRESDRGPTR
jgi:hypothetical protein